MMVLALAMPMDHWIVLSVLTQVMCVVNIYLFAGHPSVIDK